MADPGQVFQGAVNRHIGQMRTVMAIAIDKSAEILLEEMKLLTARIDHDLKQLREMGHPYKRSAPPGSPHADWIVHIQSGGLQAELNRLPAAVSGGMIEAGINSEAYYTWFLLLGTERMRPRDFVSASIMYTEKRIENLLEQAFFALHDGANKPGNSLSVQLILHDEIPAQLPGEF